MPRHLYWYLAKRVLIGTLTIQVALSVPVILSSLFHYLPPAAVRGGLLWPALLGTVPTVTYIALPMAVGVAIALEFARMMNEGMIAVLYSLRLSVWAICLPAITCAAFAAVLGYLISCWIAPHYVGNMHDVINVIRNSLNHRMLEPATFYTLDNGRRTIYFERWRTPDIAANIFIRQYSSEKKEEEVIKADQAEFRRNETGVVMILSHGSIEILPEGAQKARVAEFDENAIPLSMQGSGELPPRGWRGFFELPLSEFMFQLKWLHLERSRMAEWSSEAAKRFAIPMLALSHAFLGIGLVLAVGNATGRRSMAASAVIIAVPAVHIGILVAAESLVRLDPHLVMLVGLLIIAEFLAGIALVQHQHRGGRAVDFGRLLPRPGEPAVATT
ncbi:MAG: lipopolysaccharide export system permease protein [Methylobacteriaceae bacterium]|jgi:lipopolysaccharide export system permease protein|nr:lipopolysaccharide export system permease protein [Methylobacteriaceae bacterium]